MIKRLKQHKSGARILMREDDLVHALLMPQSRQVHIVRILVSRNGELEFGEWISGEDGSFTHKEALFSIREIEELDQSLSNLNFAERKINFKGIECDYNEYEQPTRKFLRFLFEREERGVFLPSSKFYRDFKIDDALRRQYEMAFESVISRLPLDWISETVR